MSPQLLLLGLVCLSLKMSSKETHQESLGGFLVLWDDASSPLIHKHQTSFLQHWRYVTLQCEIVNADPSLQFIWIITYWQQGQFSRSCWIQRPQHEGCGCKSTFTFKQLKQRTTVVCGASTVLCFLPNSVSSPFSSTKGWGVNKGSHTSPRLCLDCCCWPENLLRPH